MHIFSFFIIIIIRLFIYLFVYRLQWLPRPKGTELQIDVITLKSQGRSDHAPFFNLDDLATATVCPVCGLKVLFLT